MKKRGTRRCLYRDRRSLITPIPTSLFPIKLSVHIYKYSYVSSNCTPSTYTQHNSCIVHKQRCRDGVINDLLSRYRHLLVPLFFIIRHPYIPLHFREMIFPLVYIGYTTPTRWFSGYTLQVHSTSSVYTKLQSGCSVTGLYHRIRA